MELMKSDEYEFNVEHSTAVLDPLSRLDAALQDVKISVGEHNAKASGGTGGAFASR